ncbi:TPA: alpha/beta hydrolase [Enterobacter cloacae]|uniref:alpha/beta fold hydrolase n=1 Tax=Enterobacter cloacae TaxID=550 RepID=UPI0010120963|nr:alpha/beta hydrolase [Enterobacter cloacae]HAS0820593.1 alpha/beta hydrolase [Enterobacter cloacae subsp. cloacae]RXX51160.1 alpha/beta hydrolase [Enterobacter cloacae]UWA63575.1 alpha/beta hydrolase [Enterobacter cloacae]HBH6930921.1 alpha/beta hydrolase [Enterobacter cloacae]HDC4592937.1 alpha/beta hydrolase [Enterobacter cloacae]
MNSFYSQHAGCTVRWHYLPGTGDPVVFIHGLGCASSYEYPRVVRDPQFGGGRTILIDLPGSGYSDKPEHYSYKTTDQARVVAELMDHLKLDAFWLYGHSMGGSIAIEAAGLLASRVKGLMVSEPNFHAGGGMFSRSIAAQTEQQFLEQGYQAMLRAEKTAWAGCLQSNAPYAVWRGASSLVAGVEPDWETQFLSLPCPVTLIFGELSLPDDDVERLKQKGVEVKIIPAAGHSMSWENPSALAQTLAECMSA